MTTKINRRAVTAPRDAANKVAIESLSFAVQELTGAVGSNVQRAVRVCELVDAGILEILPDGQLGRSTSVDDLGIIDISDVTGLTAALNGKVSKTGDTMTGSLAMSTGTKIMGDFSNATIASRTLFQTTTTNNPTNVGVIPNGSSTSAIVQVFNSSDANNAGTFQLRMDGTIASLNVGVTGTGLQRDLHFQFGGTTRAYMQSSGSFNIFNSGAVGTLQLLQSYAWNDNVPRWKWVIEANASFSLYGYDTAGANATLAMNWATPVAGGGGFAYARIPGQLRVEGSVCSVGIRDRSTNRDWQWYATGDLMRLYNGGSDALQVATDGSIFIGSTATVNFGTGISQKLNLYGTSYQIGIQNNTQYFRSGARYSWYVGGAYDSAENSPGTGGTRLATLNSDGFLNYAGWYRSSGNAGWYSQDYGGGIYMIDSTWIRTYGSKQFYCDTVLRSELIEAGVNGFWQRNASGGAFTKQPRIFVQSTDPGSLASDGDLWFW